MSKSTKILIFLIIFVIVFMVCFAILEYKGVFNNYEADIKKENRLELNERLDYEIGKNGLYKIYDKQGNLIDEFYDEVELKMYKKVPNYNRDDFPIPDEGEDLLEESNE